MGGIDPIVTSTNSGATWTITSAPWEWWHSVASSADGTKLLAVNSSYSLVSSTNSGAAWTTTEINADFVASSADGARWVALNYGGTYVSTNAGGAWTQINASSLSWKALAVSADGGKLVAVVNGGGIWISQAAPTPSLGIARANTNLVLSWIVPSMDFALQANFDLTTTNWTDMPATPTLNFTNLQNQVTVPLRTADRFYRLKH